MLKHDVIGQNVSFWFKFDGLEVGIENIYGRTEFLLPWDVVREMGGIPGEAVEEWINESHNFNFHTVLGSKELRPGNIPTSRFMKYKGDEIAPKSD
jgi:hypothetical protein